MKTNLKNAIVPHDGNDYKPHLLRRAGVLVVLIVSVGVFAFGFLQRTLLFSPEMLATIYPNIVATLSNENRKTFNLPELTYNPLLEEAARLKAEDMVLQGYFAHVSPQGVDPWHWIKKAGYEYEYAGENLAINFSDSSDVTKAWMESPGHRANILNGKFTEVGVATVKGHVSGRETVFVVQMFGSKSAEQVAKDVAATTQSTVVSNATTTPVASSTATLQVSSTTPVVLGVMTSTEKEERPLFLALSFVISNPRLIVSALFFVLASAIALSLILTLMLFRHHHVSHVLFGFVALLWILTLFLVYMHYFGPSVLLTG